MTLTRELIEDGRSDAGGYNLGQLKVLGIAPVQGWPKTGWLKRLIGVEVTQEQYEHFLALRGPKRSRTAEAQAHWLDVMGVPKGENRRKIDPTLIGLIVEADLFANSVYEQSGRDLA